MCRLISLVVAVLVSCFLTVPLQAVVSPAGLRCEYHTNPPAIDTPQPRLSWILKSGPDERGQTQSAYQILVATAPNRLEPERADLWDSGRVTSSESAQIAYSGKPLASRAVCYWTVRVWDQDGKPSAWSEPASWSMGFMQQSDWKAQWIGGPEPKGELEQPGYLPAVYLRKSFEMKGACKRAIVYVTAAGVYELHVNGKRVGNDFFTPGWNQYDKRLFYHAYDVTALLRDGENALGAVLGDGWFGLHHNGRGKLGLLAQLHIENADGSEQVIGTDSSWQTTSDGPIRMSDMYQGERYDARKEMPGWDAPGFAATGWTAPSMDTFSKSSGKWANVTEKVRAAVRDGTLDVVVNNQRFGDPIYGVVKHLRVTYRLNDKQEHKEIAENQPLRIDAAGGTLTIEKAEYGAEQPSPKIAEAPRQAHPGSPVRKTQEIKTVRVTEPKPNVWVFDLGQNFTGWARLKATAPAGTKVTLRFVEMLNPDGTVYTTNLRGAKCTDTYTFRGNAEETWEPAFTFHGFRYVELTGVSSRPADDAITGVVLNSDAPLTSTFECSNPMLNQLFKNIVWGQRSNYLEVPTDCPQRDERMGWAGDAQAFIGTAAYNMDIAPFFTAWLRTYEDTQSPAGEFADLAPAGGGHSPGWGDAGIICPWAIYQVYGDRRMLEERYQGMARWIDWLEKNSKDYVRPDEGYGDWLNVQAELPKDVISTAYFAYSTSIMIQVAKTLGTSDDAVRYEKLLDKIKTAFNKTFVAADGRIKGHTQTAYLLALGFDLLPADKRPLAVKHLVALIDERQGHLSTGFLGVNLLLPVLTQVGRTDLAYKLLQNETYPSWGYPVKQGATTIWERWDGWTDKKGFQDPGMNSFNHYAYGSCGQWMFNTMAGIDSDGPGYGRLTIRPRPGGGISYVKASYDSIRGRVAVSWRQQADRLELDVTIPANVIATVYVPAKDASSVTEGGKPAGEVAGLKFVGMADGAAVYQAGSGSYRFAATRP